MKVAKPDVFCRLCSLFPSFPTTVRSAHSSNTLLTSVIPVKVRQFCSSSFVDQLKSTELFKRLGCSDAEISKIFLRRPSLCKVNPTNLSYKLTFLSTLGLTNSDLVKIVNSHPHFLSYRITNRDMHDRINYFHHLFGSKELLCKAIVRGPSLLIHDLNHIKSCVSQYERLGINKEELVPMLISRPKMISTTPLSNEKLDYIKSISLSNSSKMYKHVVSIIAASRLDTIREKMTNLEKFGLSDDQIMDLIRRSPLVLTLSVDKVQRNMTFVIGTLKLPSTVILQHFFLLHANLESVLKPRYLVGEKIKLMNLQPQIKGPNLLRALAMTEPRFLEAFINCHSEDVTNDLMELYTEAKAVKRLVETSRRASCKIFVPY